MTEDSRIKVPSSSSSAEIVGSLDDLLVEILLLLPVKSLVRFLSVSKKWKSLITSSCFSSRHGTGPRPAAGMFICGFRKVAFEYLHLDVQNPSIPRFNDLNFPNDPCTFWIHQASQGLLLCCSSGNSDLDDRWRRYPIRICYILNPTLNFFVKLPRPGVTNGVPRIVLGITLAFDPTKPPYRVLCVRGSEFAPDLSQIEIYSTESGQWSLAGKPFRADVDFRAGVYWNGSVHWVHHEAYKILFFNIDQEKLGSLSLPEAPEDNGIGEIRYFGESYNKLHLVLTCEETQLFVYERDGVGNWSMKYHIDLEVAIDAFPGMVFVDFYTREIAYEYAILYIVRGENESAHLVLRIVDKVVRFDLEHNSFEDIHEFEGVVLGRGLRAFEYIQSLSMFRCPALNQARE